MGKLGLMCRVVGSNFAQIGRKLIGVKISYKAKTLISPNASFRTFDGGRIEYGYKIEIRPNTEITARSGMVRLGNNCFINRNCMIVAHNSICIGDNVTIGPGTVVYDHDHNGEGGFETSPIVIENGVWIGANVVVLKGIKIGRNAVIGAGTIVTKDVPANAKVYQKKTTEFV